MGRVIWIDGLKGWIILSVLLLRKNKLIAMCYYWGNPW